MNTRPSLLIIGAGISGLMAAYLLAETFNISIVEALPRPGGRIHTIFKDGLLIEEGPEFVHGDASMTLELLKEAGLKVTEVGGESYKFENGRLVKEEQQEGGDWDTMMKQLKSLEGDMTLADFLNLYFPLPANEKFQQEVRGYAEGFDVADPATAAVQPLYEEWRHDSGPDHRIEKGYSALIAWMENNLENAGVSLRYNTRIQQVRYEENNIVAITDDEQRLEASKLLVTIPLGILAKTDGKDALQFTPPLPAYHAAANDIGFGAVVKIAVTFTEKCWAEDTGFIIGDQYFRAWWSPLPDERPMLTGWVGGPRASAILQEADEAIFENALRSLSALLQITADVLRKKVSSYHVSNRQHQAIAGGAYSFATLASAAAKKLLNEPVKNTVFFAGEALYSGPHPGTVEAALVSARAVAEKILAGGE